MSCIYVIYVFFLIFDGFYYFMYVFTNIYIAMTVNIRMESDVEKGHSNSIIIAFTQAISEMISIMVKASIYSQTEMCSKVIGGTRKGMVMEC